MTTETTTTAPPLFEGDKPRKPKQLEHPLRRMADPQSLAASEGGHSLADRLVAGEPRTVAALYSRGPIGFWPAQSAYSLPERVEIVKLAVRKI